MEWVKKQRANGSIYYFNVLTGAKMARSPNDLDATDGGDPPPPRGSAMKRIFQVRSWQGLSRHGIAYVRSLALIFLVLAALFFYRSITVPPRR